MELSTPSLFHIILGYMFDIYDTVSLLEMSGGRLVMTESHVVSIRADLVSVTPQEPHGLDYGIVLMQTGRGRLLGFDNRHAFDGAGPNDPFDHEHKLHLEGQAFPYHFKTGSQLISDFFDRIDAYIAWYRGAHNVTLEFLEMRKK